MYIYTYIFAGRGYLIPRPGSQKPQAANAGGGGGQWGGREGGAGGGQEEREREEMTEVEVGVLLKVLLSFLALLVQKYKY
jgi:hypothetical protein